MTTQMIRVEHLRKVFPYLNPDPNSNDADMWFAYLAGLLGRHAGPFAATRGRVVALEDITLTVEQGECFGILGPNGAGKTTLVKILATTLRPTAGSVTVNGFDIAQDAARVRASLAGVMAAGWLSLDSQLTVGRNLLYWARLYGLDRPTARARVSQALDLVGLAAWDDRPPGQLSSGMRQRLAIAKGLLCRAPVFILDEPTANIDPVGAYQIRDYLRNELNRRFGQTVVLTTHNMAEAEQICDRVAIVDHGQLIACDSPSRLIEDLGLVIAECAVAACSPAALHSLQERGVALRTTDVLDGAGAGRVRVHLRPGVAEDALRDALQEAGAQVEHLALMPATLEDVFLHLSGRGFHDESVAVSRDTHHDPPGG